MTFYAPKFWGVETSGDVVRSAVADPHSFYARLLSAIEETGVDYLELCFEPGDWKTARAAYATPEGFRAALAVCQLSLSGSYQGGHGLEEVLDNAALLGGMLDDLHLHAQFVRACGADLVLTGPPRRFAVNGSIEAALPDSLVKRVAELFEQMGSVTAGAGVRLAIHTEAYSCFCRPQDISRVLRETDPSLVHLCLDAGHVTLDGGDVVEVIKADSDRISNIHWKDCAGPRASLPEDGVVTHEMMMEQFRRAGTGSVDWLAVTSALRDCQFDGFAAAEIDLVPDPVGDTRAVLEFFDRELGSVYR